MQPDFVALDTDLDPRSDAEWEEARRAAHRLVDGVLDRQRTIRDSACWQPVPQEIREGLAEYPSAEGLGLEAALSRAEALIAPHATGNLHPRFWGWVLGAGNVPGMLGQWLASGMNANAFGGDQGPVHLELQVLEWFRQWFGFPEGASGLLVDGGSMANILGLAIARHRATDGRCRAEGAEACRGLRIYVSKVTHNSIQKGAELLGLGRVSVVSVAVDEADRMDLAALEIAIQADLRAGLRPFCIIGTAGTVGIGAVDPLVELRQIADRHGLWLHVDGAVGALGWLSPRLRPRLEGLDQADSLGFDLHKWGQIPYDAGCILVRDGAIHREAFQTGAEYLNGTSGGLSRAGSHAFHAYTPLLSRGDRALKIWMTFMSLGMERMESVFDRCVDLASHLSARVEAHPDLELLAPSTLNLACFRYRGLDDSKLDALNEEILVELQESGFCVMSPYRHRGRFALRVALSNHRTQARDVEALVERVVELGQRKERRSA